MPNDVRWSLAATRLHQCSIYTKILKTQYDSHNSHDSLAINPSPSQNP
jgi:hypothetical protein